MYSDGDTIVAQATAVGQGGVGIVRLSGSLSKQIASQIIGFSPTPRYAHYTSFSAKDGMPIDEGIALYFAGPHSFTGEDVFEFQAHGGPVVIDRLIKECVLLGARPAEPGEFSKRAFLNDKLDLLQAEAVADLISSQSEQAAKSALLSMQGAFSDCIDNLVDKLISIRMFVEAAIDFPEEEIDFLADSDVLDQTDEVINALELVMKQANQGALVTEGMRVVIAGKPNAGKSSLLNALAGRESAIVTNIEGTTRDVLKEQIQIDGMPLHIIDTAGLRESDDKVEQIGVQRAWEEINNADRILLVQDATKLSSFQDLSIEESWPDFLNKLDTTEHVSLVLNKVDLVDPSLVASMPKPLPSNILSLSAKSLTGLDSLRDHLKSCVGFDSNTEGQFAARRRHIVALQSAMEHIRLGKQQLVSANAGELLAEELRLAQDKLGEITGKFLPDDLLGEIFSSFCIGK